MHQPVGKIARIGKKQQTFGVEVKSADCQPFAVFERRQSVENRRPFLRIVTADDFTGRFVINQHFRQTLGNLALDQFSVDSDLIGRQNTLSDMSRFAIDGNTSRNDQFFHIAPRTQPGIGQYLVQLRCIVLSRQFTFELSGLVRCTILASDSHVAFAIDLVEFTGCDETEHIIVSAVSRCLTFASFGCIARTCALWRTLFPPGSRNLHILAALDAGYTVRVVFRPFLAYIFASLYRAFGCRTFFGNITYRFSLSGLLFFRHAFRHCFHAIGL